MGALFSVSFERHFFLSVNGMRTLLLIVTPILAICRERSSNCHECIAESVDCHWCEDVDFPGEGFSLFDKLQKNEVK